MPENRPFGLGIVLIRGTVQIIWDCAIFYKRFLCFFSVQNIPHSDYLGYGYMTEAVKALEDAFFGMGLNRLSIRANVKNKASCGVAKRLGYKKEGVVRAELFNKVMNEYEDIAYYGKLRSEWKGKK